METIKVFKTEWKPLENIKTPGMYYSYPLTKHLRHMKVSEMAVAFWTEELSDDEILETVDYKAGQEVPTNIPGL